MSSKVRFSHDVDMNTNTTTPSSSSSSSTSPNRSRNREPLLFDTPPPPPSVKQKPRPKSFFSSSSSTKKPINHYAEEEELTYSPTQQMDYGHHNDHFGSGPNLASMPSGVIDKDADTPLGSSDDDDERNGLGHDNLTLQGRNGRHRTMSRKEAGFHGKGVTTILHTACWDAKSQEVERILNSDSHAVGMLIIQDVTGETPLMKAIHSGSLRVVDLLCDFFLLKLNYKPTIESSDDHREQLPWNFKEKFLEAKNGKGNTALFKAAKAGRAEIVSKLIKVGANCNVADSEGLPAVCVAALNDHAHTLSTLLLEGQADPEARQPYTDYTPLLIAAKARAVSCIRVLLGRVNLCNKNARGSQNEWSAIHIAAHNDDVEILELLLQGGCDPDLVTIDGDTALHCSAWANSLSVCEVLVKGGADRSKANRSGQTAHDVAEERGNTKLLKILKEPSVFEKKGCPCVIQ